MATSEPARLALYNRLGEVLGPDEADTFMSVVADHSAELLATKDDIARLERQIADRRHKLKTSSIPNSGLRCVTPSPPWWR